MTVGSGSFEHGGQALAPADAHRLHGVAAATARQLVKHCGEDPAAGGADRVAERDAGAHRVESRIGRVEPELDQHGQDLGGERLVELDDVEIASASPCLCCAPRERCNS